MATTTNFGWETPDDTDLVKDGAAAMRTLGNSIDTSFVDLKGGTSGQILSKASNTDLDYTWITNDVGDITAVTAGTGITGGGTSGAVTVSFDQANFGGGQFAGAKNRVLNSNFSVWQRGTAATAIATSGTFFLADRWQCVRGGLAAGGTVSRQATNDTTNLPFIQYCARVQRDSGNASTASLNIGQNFESVNAIPLAGKTVVFSFYARAGANYSPTSSALGVQLYTGTGTDQNGLTGSYTGNTAAINTSVTLTTTWQRFTTTATLATTATELYVNFAATPTGTASTNDYFEVTGVQLEGGTSTASPYAPNGSTQQAELAACQRYYQRFGGQTAYQTLGTAYNVSTTTGKALITLPVQMRIIPTSLDFSTLMIQDSNDVICAINTLTLADAGTQVVRVIYLGTLTDNLPASLITNNSTSAFIGFSAEL
jgi:hypothetical protein